MKVRRNRSPWIVQKYNGSGGFKTLGKVLASNQPEALLNAIQKFHIVNNEEQRLIRVTPKNRRGQNGDSNAVSEKARRTDA